MAGHQPCSQCSAPLEIGPPGSVVRCAYCKVDNRMAGLTGVMPVATHPPMGAPPLTPEAQQAVRRDVRRILYIVFGMMLLPPVIIGVVWAIVVGVGAAVVLLLSFAAR